jgi:hypothetical protein
MDAERERERDEKKQTTKMMKMEMMNKIKR